MVILTRVVTHSLKHLQCLEIMIPILNVTSSEMLLLPKRKGEMDLMKAKENVSNLMELLLSFLRSKQLKI